MSSDEQKMQQFYADNWKELYTEMIETDKHKLNEEMKFELATIMAGDNAPAHKWDVSKKYKFLDTVSKKSKFPGQEQATPIDNALGQYLTQEEKKEIKELLEVIRTNAQGGRKRKRKRRRGTKKKRRKRNLKNRTRRRRRKSKRRRRR